MKSLLTRVGDVVARRPVVTLSVLAVITVVMGLFAAQQQVDTDLTSFGVDSELNDKFELVQEEFGAQGTALQVIIDGGVGGDVVSLEGLRAAARVTELAVSDPAVSAALAEGSAQAPAVVGFHQPFEIAFGGDTGFDQVDDADVNAAAGEVLANAQASALLSRDVDPDAGSAEGGLVLVRFSGDADMADISRAELSLYEALQAEDFGSVEVTAIGQAIFQEELLTDMNSELPMLLGLSFLLIIGILWFTYRRISDVLLGFVGLGMTIIWMYGAAVLMGPDYLGIAGAFSQIAIVVPVLLVGLSIDFAIHLTSRYREELSTGAKPEPAAARAIATVGAALILATVTTLVGFLTNIFSPLPPIQDFGLFVAAGVVGAFIVFVFGTPAIRSLIDRRRAAIGKLAPVAIGDSNGLARIMSRAAVVTKHAPVLTLVVALLITVVAGIAGAGVSTSFSQDDFIPADSAIGQTLERTSELFGGAVDENTYVVLEGDLATPDAFNAMLEAQANLVDTEGVRATGGNVQAVSPAVVVAQFATQPETAPAFEALGYTQGGVTPEADVAGMYNMVREFAPGSLDTVLTDDNSVGVILVSTNAGQDGAAALAAALDEDVVPVGASGVEATVVSEPLVLDEVLNELTASQTRSIVITLVAALALLVLYFGIAQRRPLLGVVAMLPSILVVAWVLGSMRAFGMSFNVLTATVASLAIGIGVPYGIHITYRFLEDIDKTPDVDSAIKETVTHTGGALAGSAATTVAGFGVLAFASLEPIQQFGLITAVTIAFSLVAAILVEPAALKLWANWRLPHKRNGDTVPDRVGAGVSGDQPGT